jgi:glyoxylase-like metal-dependent hydrolase (beta-lactamase superfamily II)
MVPVLACLLPLAAKDAPAQTGSVGAQVKTAADPQSETIEIQKVKSEIYVIKGGSGANSGLFAGPVQAVVIDAKMTETSAADMTVEIRKITTNPIRWILLTHSDRDHVNGLSGFSGDAVVLSHEAARKDMDEAFQEEPLRSRLPSVTFSERASVYDGSVKVEVYFFGRAHTSGDAVVLFPADKIAFTGDLVAVGRDPLIHLAKNGTSFGLVKVLRKILELNADTFIPGHGDVAGRAEIEAEIENLEEKQAAVKALVDHGKTLDEVKKAFGVQEGGRWMSLVEVIFRELTEKK